MQSVFKLDGKMKWFKRVQKRINFQDKMTQLCIKFHLILTF